MVPIPHVMCIFAILAAVSRLNADTDAGPARFRLPLESPAIWNKPQGSLTLQSEPDTAATRIQAEPSSFLYTRSGVLPRDLSVFSHLRCTFRSDQNRPAVMEVQFLERGGKAKFWRKVDLPAATETEVDLPLRFTRPGSGTQPHWDRVLYLGLYFRNGFKGRLEKVHLIAKEGEDAWMHPAHLQRLAFEGNGTLALREKRLAVLTHVEELDAEKLADHLMQADRWLRKHLPYLGDPPSVPTLIVFNNQQNYAGFHRRLGKKLNAKIAPPTSDGYAVQGIATSSAAEDPAFFRPVFLHEFVHAHLDKVAGISSEKGDWFQEGMATALQLRFHPQDNFPALVLDSLSKPSHWTPLHQLCDGNRIPLNRYWQAATLVDMLSQDPKYAPSFAKLVKSFADSGNTRLAGKWDLLPVSDWNELETDWKAFCLRHYRHTEP